MAGTLRSEGAKRRLHLDLIGAFDTVIPGENDAPPPSYPVVLGSTRDGDVLLEDCNVLRWATRERLTAEILAEEQTLWVGAAFVGGASHHLQPPLVREARVTCPLLADWVAAPPFSHRVGAVSSPSGDGIAERWELTIPPDVAARAGDAEVRVAFQEGYKEGKDFFHARRPVSLVVVPDAAVTLDELLRRLLGPLEYLLGVLCDTDFRFGELEVRFADDTEEYSRATTVEYAGQGPASEAKAAWWEMPFTLGTLGVRWPDILATWFSLQGAGRTPLDLYFASQSERLPQLETSFLLLVQAVEVLHRRLLDRARGPSAEHQARLVAILDAVPAEHREWLKDRLAFSHEATFATRLEEVLEHSGLRGTPVLQDDFITKVKHTRHYLTHFAPRLERKAASGSELLWLREQVMLVMQAALLHSAGLSVEESLKGLSRTARVRNVHWHLTSAAAT